MILNFKEISLNLSSLKIKQLLENLTKSLKKSIADIKAMIENNQIIFLFKKSDYIFYQVKSDNKAFKFYL